MFNINVSDEDSKYQHVIPAFTSSNSLYNSSKWAITGGIFSKQRPERVRTEVRINGHQKLVSCLTRFMRNLVSKKRRRMLIAGYDLDMSYITDRILAMSFPAESMRAMYRNPLWQVKSALEMGHSDHYKVQCFPSFFSCVTNKNNDH